MKTREFRERLLIALVQHAKRKGLGQYIDPAVAADAAGLGRGPGQLRSVIVDLNARGFVDVSYTLGGGDEGGLNLRVTNSAVEEAEDLLDGHLEYAEEVVPIRVLAADPDPSLTNSDTEGNVPYARTSRAVSGAGEDRRGDGVASGYVDAKTRQRLLALIAVAVEKFNSGDWLALGTHTGSMDLVKNHDRLLRSLSFGDDDYSGCAHEVMLAIVEREHANLGVIEDYIATNYGGVGVSISTPPSKGRPITFAPSVFEIPPGGIEPDLVAVMMPFAPQFEAVFKSISAAAAIAKMRCLRAKDIWIHEVVIQDVFSLIFRSQIVVCDFTGKNPNVFYEAGIAHTLGKTVIPITQSEQDIPFDLRHHRYLSYLGNGEGLAALTNDLSRRLAALAPAELSPAQQ